MAHRFFRFNKLVLAAAASGLTSLPAAAQGGGTVTVTGRPALPASIAGFGDAPLEKSPLQASVFGAQQLSDAGVASLASITRLDASLGDAYNAEGYWSMLSSRGYTLDNRFNYRRDGLPINAETALALDNKERVELFKGTSGIQAGTSAPGGLVNLVVKRPAGPARSARLEARQGGGWLAAVDLGGRFGADQRLGLRLNAAHEHLDPQVRNAQGQRSLLALAADWQLRPGTLLQAELESSRQSQPSVPGFSMLGNAVPRAASIDPRINLNNQAWSKPVVLDGDTASLRVQQQLSEHWQATVHAMTQGLKNDDRVAFPYGVYDVNYNCAQWCDRYAPDGTFSFWEFVSDKERRRSSALSLAISGRLRTAAVQHQLEAGALTSRYRARFQDQVFDLAGTGRIDGGLQSPPSAGFTDANTNLDERSTEVYLRDAMRLTPSWQLWAGVRHTRLERSSQRTSPASDGLRPTSYQQGVTLPWLAVAHDLTPTTLLYASWGQGLESSVAPNRARYTNRGQALPALKSSQVELGVKHAQGSTEWSLTVFDIDRPQTADLGSCTSANTCTRAIDGSARHRGIEAQGKLSWQAWTGQASAMLLDARRQGSGEPGINGERPANVPTYALRLSTEYRAPSVPGLVLSAGFSAEGDRVVLPYDTSVRIAAWQRWDVGARWRQQLGAQTWVWRVGVDNLFDRRAWKESPYQFGHVYLYPMAPRTLRVSLQASF